MNTRDYITPPGGSVLDRLIEESGHGSIGGAHAWAADLRRIDDLAFEPGTQGDANYRSPGFDPHSEPGSVWPFYRLYQPEMPPPVGYERLAAPPPVSAPDPEPRLPLYSDSLMTEALFDWGIRHVASTSTSREGPVGPSSDVIPARLAEIVIDSLIPEPPPLNGPW